MTTPGFSARLTRKIVNSPETGLEPRQFEMLIDCYGEESSVIFGSKDLAGAAQLQRSLIDQIGRVPPDARIARARIESSRRP